MRLHRLTLLAALLLSIHSLHAADLLNDDYNGLDLGMFSSGVVGAMTEYHYLPAIAPRGNWVVSDFRTDGSQRAWRVVADDSGKRFMDQSYTAGDVERPYIHPIVIAGDELWTDYTVETAFAPEADDGGMSGVIFRYHNDRRYYFAGTLGQKAIIKKLDEGVGFRKMNETILAQSPLAWKPGESISIKIEVAGDRLHATIGSAVLDAQDATFPRGKIGLVSDMPTRFGPVRVTCSQENKDKFDAAVKQRQADEDARVAANPKMVLWKKISTSGFGVGRNLRFGDLDGDGKIDILIAQQIRHGPADAYSETGCLTAMNLDGKILWQNGKADPWNYQLTNDTAVQINDIDGDGKNEVVYCRDYELVVADGATGQTKYKVATPPTRPDVLGTQKRIPNVLGDSIVFADLHGAGARRDIILKDRYQNVWAYDNKLNQLWTLHLNTGHFPFPYDVDGDGRDEVMIGYSLVSSDGKVLWTNESKLQDHADALAITHFKDGGDLRLACGASDEGFFYADMKGNFIKRYHYGHVQNVSIADYRPDLPGLETVTINFWGNQGIVHFFDADGNPYYDFEPAQHGSMLLPVNWTGKPGEFWCLSPNTTEGGLFDGWGRRVVRFPADGHPDMCVAVLDLFGDCRDEIVCWDPWEIWIYTQSDNPIAGKLYKPTRNPLCNYSNYQATVSLPGWSQ